MKSHSFLSRLLSIITLITMAVAFPAARAQADTPDLAATNPLSTLPQQDILPQGFSEVPTALKLSPREGNPTAVVIDQANGFAYYGTNDLPTALIVKVRLSDFTRVGSIILTPEEGDLSSAVFDPAHGLAYFGTGSKSTNAEIIRVDVNPAHLFARLDSLVAIPGGLGGVPGLISAVFDPLHDLAYFGTTGSSTSTIIKVDVNPSHFALGDAIQTMSDETNLTTAVIDPAAGFAYFGTFTHPAIVVKVDVNPAHTFSRIGSISLTPSKEEQSNCSLIDPANGFAYFCASSSTPGVWGSLVKINLASFTRVTAGQIPFVITPGSVAYDPGSGMAYVGSTDTGTPLVRQVRLSDLTTIKSLSLTNFGSFLKTAVVDAPGGFAYFTSYSAFAPGGKPGSVVKVRLSDLSQAGILTFSPGDFDIASGVIDTAAGFAYYGTDTDPGRIIKIRMADFTEVSTLVLPAGEKNLISAVSDPAGGYAYFGTDTNPGKVIKIRLSDFTRVGALTLNIGEAFLGSAVIDPAAGFAYFGAAAMPGIIVRVNLSDFTRSAALTLPSGEESPNCALIDPAHGFAYFCTNGFNNIRLVKVQLSDFTRVNSAHQWDDVDPVSTAAIDPTTGFAYFSQIQPSHPGIIGQVKLADLTRGGSLSLPDTSDDFKSVAIDPAGGFIYYGMDDDPGKVIKVNLTTLKISDTITLASGETLTAVPGLIDPSAGYAYFVATDYKTKVMIIRIDISNTTLPPVTMTVSSSSNPAGVGQAVTFTAAVKPVSGSGTPTGSVQFKVDGASIGAPILLANGSATLTTSTLTKGTHAITVVYSGDSGYNGRTSPVLTQTINDLKYVFLPKLVR